jgi:hypothetical protein
MQKEIFILTGDADDSYQVFGDKMLDLVKSLAEKYDPESFRLTLTTRKPPLISVIPFRRSKIAVFSVKGASSGFRESIEGQKGFRGGYIVEEAVPVAYDKTWPDGTRIPGVCLLTLFHRKPGMDQELFISRWHQGHTSLSLRIHPLWNYNRNVIIKATNRKSEWFDGIVEEQFKEASHLLNPFIFFGPPLKVPQHMTEVLRDTRSFIDMKRIETYLATEFQIKS